MKLNRKSKELHTRNIHLSLKQRPIYKIIEKIVRLLFYLGLK